MNKPKKIPTKIDSRQPTANSWHLYIAECADGTYYTGITKDVQARIAAHNQGKGSKYTATHRPVQLVFQEPQADYSSALRREYQIKTLPKKRKVLFIAGMDLPAPAPKAKMTFQRHQKINLTSTRWPSTKGSKKHETQSLQGKPLKVKKRKGSQ